MRDPVPDFMAAFDAICLSGVTLAVVAPAGCVAEVVPRDARTCVSIDIDALAHPRVRVGRAGRLLGFRGTPAFSRGGNTLPTKSALMCWPSCVGLHVGSTVVVK